MVLCRFFRVVDGVQVVSVGTVRMMGGLLMVARRVVFRSLSMVSSSMFVMFGGFNMVLCTLFAHVWFSFQGFGNFSQPLN
jgi:hypothetical protein